MHKCCPQHYCMDTKKNEIRQRSWLKYAEKSEYEKK